MADLSEDDINQEYVKTIHRFPNKLALKRRSASMAKFSMQRVQVCRSNLFTKRAR